MRMRRAHRGGRERSQGFRYAPVPVALAAAPLDERKLSGAGRIFEGTWRPTRTALHAGPIVPRGQDDQGVS